MTSPLRDKILAADTFGTAKVLDVPEWGVEVVLRPPSGRERARLGARFQNARVDPDDPATLDLEKAVEIYPALLVACVRDEHGKQVFSDEDIDALLDQNGALIERIAQECMVAAGFQEEALVAGKDG